MTTKHNVSNIHNLIARGFINIYVYIFAAIVGVMAVVSFTTTITFEMYSENDLPQMSIDNVPLLVITAALLMAYFYHVRYKTDVLEHPKGVTIIVVAVAAAFMLTLIFTVHPLAVTDGLTLDNCINEFASGDYSSLTEKGGYLNIYPFQLGYVAFGELMYHLFGASNYTAYQIVNVIVILMIVLSLYLITWECFEERQVSSIAAMLGLLLVFLYVYSVYIYTDIISLGPEILALYLQIRFMKYGKVRDEIIAAVVVAISVMLKMNSYIAVIAMVVMLVLDLVRKITDRDNTELRNSMMNRLFMIIKYVVLMALIVILSSGSTKLINNYYANRIGIESIPEGVPRTAHIAMALQESGTENGWYNAYNVNVFAANDYDTEAANIEATENIKERISLFIEHPYYAVRFFVRKFVMQWADPTCVSMRNLELTSRHVEGQGWLCNFLVYGTGKTILEWIMNTAHLFMYAGAFSYIFFAIKNKKINFYAAFLILFICGGMAFHEIWEASGRYTMRYYVALLPLSAKGVENICKLWYDRH